KSKIQPHQKYFAKYCKRLGRIWNFGNRARFNVIFILPAIDDCKKQRQFAFVAYIGLLTKMAGQKCGQNMVAGLFIHYCCCPYTYRNYARFIFATFFCKQGKPSMVAQLERMAYCSCS